MSFLASFCRRQDNRNKKKTTADNNGVTKDGWFEFNDWTEMKELEYWVNVDYRIKPEPKFRPFKDAEECWQEMLKHQPFGWVKFKDTESGYYMITIIAINVVVGLNDTPFSYEREYLMITHLPMEPHSVLNWGNSYGMGMC